MKIFRLPRWRLSPFLGALLAAGAGLLCHFSEIGEPLERVSYDLLFPLRSDLSTREVAIVYLDESAARALGQPLDRPWDRRIFAALVDRLRAGGAKLICFDLIFSTPSADPAADAEFAQAMSRHGGVVLGGDYAEREQSGVHINVIEKPNVVLREAQAAWGLLIFRPIDRDGAVRQLCQRYQGVPTFAMAAAAHERPSSAEPEANPSEVRWLNYYGPAGKSFDGVSIADALREEGVAPDFFRGRTVFVGGRYSSGSLSSAKDVFGNPYSRLGRRFSPGVEIHATAYLNLLRQEWWRRPARSTELACLLAFGLLLGAGLCLLRPHWALLVTVSIAALFFAGSCVLAWRQLTWLQWAIPVAVQLPVALAWSVGAQYFFEQRRRVALRRAFSFYLSPDMADRIADSDFDLRPGGRAVETTVVFTDLENFTTLSEALEVEEVSRILIAYFTETTKHILENKGTIIKYIGDAVMATWNAPLPDPQHARHAVVAAWALAEASNREIGGRRLRTRVGIHTGRALAGNLGSPFRFDYTVIGDTTNFANRLEGMNKYLGTQILLSDATASGLGGEFVTRPLGKFVVKGKTLPVSLFELLGPRTPEWDASDGGGLVWFTSFCAGVEAFARGDLDESSRLMAETISQRGGADGPAQFYLRQIALARETGVADGLVRMEEK